MVEIKINSIDFKDNLEIINRILENSNLPNFKGMNTNVKIVKTSVEILKWCLLNPNHRIVLTSEKYFKRGEINLTNIIWRDKISKINIYEENQRLEKEINSLKYQIKKLQDKNGKK